MSEISKTPETDELRQKLTHAVKEWAAGKLYVEDFGALLNHALNVTARLEKDLADTKATLKANQPVTSSEPPAGMPPMPAP